VSDEELENLAKAATPGTWSVWTSNSVRRITSDANSTHRDGGVLSAVSTRDGMPDLHGDNRDRDLEYIAACSPDRILTLLARVQRLETLEQAAREWRSAWLPYQRPARRLASNDALCAAIDALTTTEPKP
jgi:hypothetical protein